MAEKKVIGNLKLRIPGGKATAGPPVGSTLGQWGLNMMDFINPFNEKTKDFMGKNVIVHIKVYEDRTSKSKKVRASQTSTRSAKSPALSSKKLLTKRWINLTPTISKAPSKSSLVLLAQWA